MGKKFNIRQTHFFHDYASRLKNVAMSVFKWELPDTCNERFLEDTLYHFGKACIILDPDMSYLNLRCTPSSILNVYNESTAFECFSTGYSKTFEAENCVFIRNNYIEKSTESTLILYAERLANLEMIMQVNLNAQKTPLLIHCDKQTEMSLRAIYDQFEENKPAIFGSKSLSDKPLNVLLTGAPYIVDKVREEKRAVWNEALEFIGVNTNPSDKKKERLIVSEVESNNEEIDIQKHTMLLCRQEAVKQAKKKLDLDISVSVRLDEAEKAVEAVEKECA